ncbi:LacI family DNA-binding transcriptional regulator [Vibrio sp. SCSIO 43136]|uniref:LacI family DNA-binding transcriptional regulator n=1 Tax=Vibrio sp. SCSIO 43136 TaxID=2819101 RepID=UPI00207550AD|nr:LacI family DNA-binding transcriptional regulator [Vibrio sp. SCSIO 43136]USD67327.1 LacI family DNA-binding transcriptional regulator [Vibrio sp. SCSIO 43136]
MTKVRIIDVAEKAGVSKSTVSQYLNGRFGHMSEATKERIKLAVAELNYVPNPIARSLKTDSTKTIGVIVRDITGFNTSRVLRGIDDFCKGSQFNVFIYNTDFDPDIERRALTNLKEMRADGIIITSSGKNNDLIREYVEQGIPLVQFQLEYDDAPSDMVLSDYRQAAFEATEHLIKLGHRRISFLTQDFSLSNSRKARYQGYVDALEKHDIKLDTDLIHYWDRQHGFDQAPTKILSQANPPTAFFSQHLALTTDVLKDLDGSSFKIPQDVSLIGFDDIPMVELFKVPVTVVKQDAYKTGELSAKLLLSKVKSKSKTLEKIVIPCELVERDSCSPIAQ